MRINVCEWFYLSLIAHFTLFLTFNFELSIPRGYKNSKVTVFKIIKIKIALRKRFKNSRISLCDERSTTRFSISYNIVILLLICKKRTFSPVFGTFFPNPYKINDFGSFNFILVLCNSKYDILYMNQQFWEPLFLWYVQKIYRVEERLALGCACENHA